MCVREGACLCCQHDLGLKAIPNRLCEESACRWIAANESFRGEGPGWEDKAGRCCRGKVQGDRGQAGISPEKVLFGGNNNNHSVPFNKQSCNSVI